MNMSLGVFAGIFNSENKLLLRRRVRENPNIPCSYEGDWELPGGTVEEQTILSGDNKSILYEELRREVFEEVGLDIPLNNIYFAYPFMSLSSRGMFDLSLLMPVGVVELEPDNGEWMYVNPSEVKELCFQPEGNRIVSGWGNRMCRMSLYAFLSCSNEKYKEQAKTMIDMF